MEIIYSYYFSLPIFLIILVIFYNKIRFLKKKLKNEDLAMTDILMEVKEKEGRNIALELHDNIGSSLNLLKLNFSRLKSSFEKDDETKKIFEITEAVIDDIYRKIRAISHQKLISLHPFGLIQAVENLVETLNITSKTFFSVVPQGFSNRIKNDLELVILRIIQELCTNIVQHAEASEAVIYLTCSNSEINIMVQDNGKGFDYEGVRKNTGIGLKNIEQRVRNVKGTFTVDSIISKGTTIIIDLPI